MGVSLVSYGHFIVDWQLILRRVKKGLICISDPPELNLQHHYKELRWMSVRLVVPPLCETCGLREEDIVKVTFTVKPATDTTCHTFV